MPPCLGLGADLASSPRLGSQGGKLGRAGSGALDPPARRSALPARPGLPSFVGSTSMLAAGAAHVSQPQKQIPCSIGKKNKVRELV